MIQFRVLVVDDSPAQLALIEQLLFSAPHYQFVVQTALSFESAQKQILSGTYDALLVDYQLGTRSGIELLEWAQDNKCTTPVILITGQSNHDLDLEAISLGAADYLEKTELRPATLERAIRYAVERGRITESLRVSEENERQQRILVESLRDISIALSSDAEFHTVLDLILQSAMQFFEFEVAVVMLVDGEMVRTLHTYGESYNVPVESRVIFSRQVRRFTYLENGSQPLVIADTRPLNDLEALLNLTNMTSWAGSPIYVGTRLVGCLNLFSEATNHFSLEICEKLLRIFSSQIGIAIQNLDSLQQAQQLAVFEERQRLARDLHDSLSQTLFSATVIAETLPRIWNNLPQQAETQLKDLYSLTRQAQFDMRSLIIEMRPQALAETEIIELLHQLIQAFESRSQTRVISRLERCDQLSNDVKLVTYRIVQESLNNVARHSNASKVRLTLTNPQHERIGLVIEDDGCGFDQNHVPLDHFGLRMMRERVKVIGGSLDIVSQIGVGTRISFDWDAHAKFNQ
ncbi:MAG TPA: response regulator [Aggregatilineales bacterium]|nr:response regulator [Anaerolineae bacterium]HUN09083.1 response regulator [Aggregatilineales bacterium]